ncbi:hypothetical protein [Pseudorhizobium pelagicum]|uniref:Uncharacterized protein n=1 Tax=Pseudorhizobium pelagicum TaxID=1509405 RepID=A0A922T4X0_9HYPH|nr:hypothetical protein [Pseudorhizobium pelagicum]KEQ02281.1 hypothetical protein GV68_23530 [Pseudorhizobium pelagicum]KEQ03234.1 hypothetical protein GV67_13990 [Pseudorhizobium pelagicum]
MSSTTDFIAELVRAANEVEKLSAYEKVRLLDRAVTTIRDMREQVGIPSSGTDADAVVDLQMTRVAFARGKRTGDHVRAALLDAADMIRTLRIVSDTETEVVLSTAPREEPPQ